MNPRFLLWLLPAILCFMTTGCTVTDKAIATAEVAAAGNDRYAELAQKALDGTAVFAGDGLHPITGDELKATPESVKHLINKLLDGLHSNRFAFYSISFQLGEGDDPDTLGLGGPVEIPDENADLLEDPPEDGQ
jgi:hypothetical protein